MKFIARILCALFVGAIFAGSVLAVIGGIFALLEQISGHRMSPRGAGWGFAIIAALIGGLRAGYKLPDNMDLLEIFWVSLIESKVGRAVLVLTIAWIAGWTAYAWTTIEAYDPSCYENCGTWGMAEWTTYLGALFGVPIGVSIGYLVLRWVGSGK